METLSYSSELHFADSFSFRPFSSLHPRLQAGHIKLLSEGIEVNFCWLPALSGGSVVLRVASKQLLVDQWEGLFRKSQHHIEKSFCLGGIHASFTTESVTLRTKVRMISPCWPRDKLHIRQTSALKHRQITNSNGNTKAKPLGVLSCMMRLCWKTTFVRMLRLMFS